MAQERTEYTDAAGYEINLEGLAEDLKALDAATEYLAQRMAALNQLSSSSMASLVGGGSPDADHARYRQDFAKKWSTAADELLKRRKALTDSVTSFTDAMHDVHDTYAEAEDGNAANFRAIANH